MYEEKVSLEEYKGLYKKNNRNRNLLIGGIIVLLIYIFFFTSKITISPNISEEATNIGQKYEYGTQRSYDLINATYSKEDKAMEVVVEFKNSNYDNINDHYYAAEILNGNSGKLEVKQIYNEDLFTVIRIFNVPKRYKELTLYFAPKTVAMEDVTDDMTGSIIINKKNVKLGDINFEKSKTSYLKERFDAVMKRYMKELKSLEKEYDSLKNELSAIEKDRQSFKENQAYMTAEEIRVQEENQVFNTDEEARIKVELAEKEKEIDNLKSEIKATKEKKNNI